MRRDFAALEPRCAVRAVALVLLIADQGGIGDAVMTANEKRAEKT
jgi:hypothetical protein